VGIIGFVPELEPEDEGMLNLIPESLRDHIKTALFIVTKCLQMKGATFNDVFISEPEDLLIKLCNLLKIKNDWEMSFSCLKLVLALLERYEKLNNALPMGAIRQSELLEKVS